MNSFFHNLTKSNWGFPWHIILACFGSSVGLHILNLIPILKMQPFLWRRILVWFVVNAIGYSYEAYQKRKEGPNKKDMFQDILANNIGIFLGWL